MGADWSRVLKTRFYSTCFYNGIYKHGKCFLFLPMRKVLNTEVGMNMTRYSTEDSTEHVHKFVLHKVKIE